MLSNSKESDTPKELNLKSCALSDEELEKVSGGDDDGGITDGLPKGPCGFYLCFCASSKNSRGCLGSACPFY